LKNKLNDISFQEVLTNQYKNNING